MEIILYIAVGVIIGGIVGWLFAKAKTTSAIQAEKDAAQQKYSELEKDFVGYKATATSQLQTANENLDAKLKDIAELKQSIQADALELSSLNNQVSTANADLRAANQTIVDKNAALEAAKEELKVIKNDYAISSQQLATAKANNEALTEKLQIQKDEMEAMGKKFNTEFENIANKILDTKSEKFTELNKTNLTSILEPLGKNITEFKTKVEEVYDKESKERFSLGEKVKELAQLNKVISEEAHNLTRALKSESKTQGGWGEMILENILERSGLVKDREYFMEHQLLDENGIPMKSDSEDKKMRPDAVIKYPDNRNVIIDSKVSLNAFTRCIAAMDEESRVSELSEHISCIKKHIISLSAKGYDDYNKSLDFVMMFIPSEPAYIAALQGDPDLWNFAYDRRILLLSPTNLITSLKLIVDLWKREYQNQNALEIAERGAKLYDKFVGFVSNLEGVGDHLEKAQGKYTEAYKQLSTGSDNLVTQATKLKNLGLKTKKDLPNEIVNAAIINELNG
ncbi:MAG: DNA recombination protein RmuC [Niastella sp.]|nr:DNA recombination protein RmuC [Niastella sp.]